LATLETFESFSVSCDNLKEFEKKERINDNEYERKRS
jgi:hypothetical protein